MDGQETKGKKKEDSKKDLAKNSQKKEEGDLKGKGRKSSLPKSSSSSSSSSSSTQSKDPSKSSRQKSYSSKEPLSGANSKGKQLSNQPVIGKRRKAKSKISFFPYAEDSSDEEEAVQKKEKIMQESMLFPSLNKRDSDKSLLFLSINYGVKLLYCDQVESAYRLKKYMLNSSKQDDDVFCLEGYFLESFLIKELKDFLTSVLNLIFSGTSLKNCKRVILDILMGNLSDVISHCKSTDEIIQYLDETENEGINFLDFCSKVKKDIKKEDKIPKLLAKKSIQALVEKLDKLVGNSYISEMGVNVVAPSSLEEQPLPSKQKKIIILEGYEDVIDRVISVIVIKISRKIRFIEYSRPFLAEDHCFKSSNIVDYLSNIRLSIRSIRRYGKQTFFDDNPLYFTRSFNYHWDFQCSAVSKGLIAEEDQLVHISEKAEMDRAKTVNFDKKEYIKCIKRGGKKGKDARVMETVSNIGAYDSVIQQLSRLRFLGITDSNVAKLIRSTLNGEKFEIDNKYKVFIASLTYLMFGCEVKRNPAALITNQMVLDLVENEECSFDDFFINKGAESLMPMGANGAPAESTFFLDKMESELLYPYYIEGRRSTGAANLGENHQALMHRWGEWFDSTISEDEEVVSFDDLGLEDQFDLLNQFIQDSLKEWYPRLNLSNTDVEEEDFQKQLSSPSSFS